MADKKVSLNVIREFVGHSEDSKEIEKIYLHVMQKGKYKIEQAMIDLTEIIISLKLIIRVDIPCE